MDSALVRWRIRARLEDGRLPHGDIAGLIETRGDGHRCDACGAAFETYERAHSAVVIEDWVELWFHRGCLQLWDAERHTAYRRST